MEGMNTYKVTLVNGGKEKVVHLREMEMSTEEMAIRSVGNKAGSNEMLAGHMIQNEILKSLILEVDGKKLSVIEKESLQKLFSYQEMVSLRKTVQKIMGTGESEDPKLELLRTSGEQ